MIASGVGWLLDFLALLTDSGGGVAGGGYVRLTITAASSKILVNFIIVGSLVASSDASVATCSSRQLAGPLIILSPIDMFMFGHQFIGASSNVA